MADNTAVTASDKTTIPHTPTEKATHDTLSEYRLNTPTTQADKTPPQNAPKESGDLSVTPIQTLLPKSEAPTAPGRPSDITVPSKDAADNAEGRTDINQGQENILNAAKDAVGKELWKGTKHEDVVNGGKLGAAVSVSEVLKSSGVTDAVDSASIAGVEDQMKKAGFVQKDLADAQPGDVVVYQPSESNPSKRIGIVGDPNSSGKPTIYQMDREGTWRHHDMRVMGPSTKVYTPGCGE